MNWIAVQNMDGYIRQGKLRPFAQRVGTCQVRLNLKSFLKAWAEVLVT